MKSKHTSLSHPGRLHFHELRVQSGGSRALARKGILTLLAATEESHGALAIDTIKKVLTQQQASPWLEPCSKDENSYRCDLFYVKAELQSLVACGFITPSMDGMLECYRITEAGRDCLQQSRFDGGEIAGSDENSEQKIVEKSDVQKLLTAHLPSRDPRIDLILTELEPGTPWRKVEIVISNSLSPEADLTKTILQQLKEDRIPFR